LQTEADQAAYTLRDEKEIKYRVNKELLNTFLEKNILLTTVVS
jgi:hypothetical protein